MSLRVAPVVLYTIDVKVVDVVMMMNELRSGVIGDKSEARHRM